MSKISKLSIFTAIIIILAFTPAIQCAEQTVLYQVSTLNALQEGIYDGVVSFYSLSTHGDFGIGTFDGLDGEMIMLKGIIYQVRADGKVYKPAITDKTPFADVVNFSPDISIHFANGMDFAQLENKIIASLPSKNIPYAIMIKGNFSYIKTRSVKKQLKPYPRLADAVKEQVIFEMKNIKGTIIGYVMPQNFSGINMAGLHLHFIDDTGTKGGHLLDCVVLDCWLELCSIYSLKLDFPHSKDFMEQDLNGDKQKELGKIEK